MNQFFLRMSGNNLTKFNIRVYGIFIRDKQVLLSDERLNGFEFTKFPGGGLEFGEGTHQCIIREMKEETGLNFNINSHYYTTDFFQVSAFYPNHQIISIYYLISGPDLPNELLSSQKFGFPNEEKTSQVFRWKPIKDLTLEDLNFPIDRKVAEKLLEDFS